MRKVEVHIFANCRIARTRAPPTISCSLAPPESLQGEQRVYQQPYWHKTYANCRLTGWRHLHEKKLFALLWLGNVRGNVRILCKGRMVSLSVSYHHSPNTYHERFECRSPPLRQTVTDLPISPAAGTHTAWSIAVWIVLFGCQTFV